jgi:hypothetical protein
MLKPKHILASMIYFDSDMTKSTNTVVYFDWKTVIYIYTAIVLFEQSKCVGSIFTSDKRSLTVIHVKTPNTFWLPGFVS